MTTVTTAIVNNANAYLAALQPYSRALRTLRVCADENNASLLPASSSHTATNAGHASTAGNVNVTVTATATATAGATADKENARASAKSRAAPVLAQRNKSASALSTLSSNVFTLHHAVRRTAFSDPVGGLLPSVPEKSQVWDQGHSHRRPVTTQQQNQAHAVADVIDGQSADTLARQGPRTNRDAALSFDRASTTRVTTAPTGAGIRPPIPIKSAARSTHDLSGLAPTSIRLVDVGVDNEAGTHQQTAVIPPSHEAISATVTALASTSSSSSCTSSHRTARYERDAADVHDSSVACKPHHTTRLANVGEQDEEDAIGDVSDTSSISTASLSSSAGSDSPSSATADYGDHANVNVGISIGLDNQRDKRIVGSSRTTASNGALDGFDSGFRGCQQDDGAVPIPSDVLDASPDTTALVQLAGEATNTHIDAMTTGDPQLREH
ncbi:hypothetical protein KEM52_002915, partial [Ascosphaera acerosa]